MSEEKLDQIFASVEPSRRAILKKMVIGGGFAIPVIVSFSVTDLMAQGIGSPATSSSVKTSTAMVSSLTTTLFSSTAFTSTTTALTTFTMTLPATTV
jgi:hypothetical protein